MPSCLKKLLSHLEKNDRVGTFFQRGQCVHHYWVSTKWFPASCGLRMFDLYCRKADEKSVCEYYAIGQVPKGFHSSKIHHHWSVIVQAGLTQTEDDLKVLLEGSGWFKRPVNTKQLAAAVSWDLRWCSVCPAPIVMLCCQNSLCTLSSDVECQLRADNSF